MPVEVSPGFWRPKEGVVDFDYWWDVYDTFVRTVLNAATPDPIGIALAISEPLALTAAWLHLDTLDRDILEYRMKLIGFSRVVIEVSGVEVVNYVATGGSVAHFLDYRAEGGSPNPARIGRRPNGIVGTIP